MAASTRQLCLLGFRGLFQLNSSRPAARLFSCSSVMKGAHDQEFASAQQRVTTLSERPDNTTMLKLYGLFKQASTGKCNAAKPGAFDFVAKAKWGAWSELGDMSQDDAQKSYIGLVNELVKADGGDVEAPSSSAAEAAAPTGSYQNITVTYADKIGTILLNRPSKKNAITVEMYNEIIAALKEVGESKSCTLGVITGAGDFYCSGNDLSNFANIDPSAIAKMAKDGRDLLQDFVDAIIDFPKPLIAVVNGPAVGVATTTLGLCDVVYATDKAAFQTPMVALGQSAEGCSAYTFPKIMGLSRANEMLLFCKKISARQAQEWGLVTEVYPEESFQKEVTAKIKELAQLPPQSMKLSKQLLRGIEREKLKQVNRQECDLLEERWQSEECFKAVMDFFTKKSSKL